MIPEKNFFLLVLEKVSMSKRRYFFTNTTSKVHKFQKKFLNEGNEGLVS